MVVHGIIGIMQLVTMKVMLVITDAEVVGEISGAEVCRVTRAGMIQLTSPSHQSAAAAKLNESESKAQRGFVSAMHSFTENHDFYFSADYDLTNCAQARAQLPEEVLVLPKWQQANKTFFWNFHLSEPLIASGVCVFPPRHRLYKRSHFFPPAA